MHYNGHRESIYVMIDHSKTVSAFTEWNLYHMAVNTIVVTFNESNVVYN